MRSLGTGSSRPVRGPWKFSRVGLEKSRVTSASAAGQFIYLPKGRILLTILTSLVTFSFFKSTLLRRISYWAMAAIMPSLSGGSSEELPRSSLTRRIAWAAVSGSLSINLTGPMVRAVIISVFLSKNWSSPPYWRYRSAAASLERLSYSRVLRRRLRKSGTYDSSPWAWDSSNCARTEIPADLIKWTAISTRSSSIGRK